jgi:hypothetical protein
MKKLTDLQFKTLKLFAALRPPRDHKGDPWFISKKEWAKRHKASPYAVSRLRAKGLLEAGNKGEHRITPKGIEVYREINGSDSTL